MASKCYGCGALFKTNEQVIKTNIERYHVNCYASYKKGLNYMNVKCVVCGMRFEDSREHYEIESLIGGKTIKQRVHVSCWNKNISFNEEK